MISNQCHERARRLFRVRRSSRILGLLLMFPLLTALDCGNIPRGSTEKNDLSAMMQVSMEITGRRTYTAYIADTGHRTQLGLMNITEAELPADRGMVFVFKDDDERSFWMRNTIIPLDIAYIRSDGTIVKTYTMEPLRESGYASIEPARFVLEVRGGQFAQWGVVEGDKVVIPAELFDMGVY